MGTGCGRRRAPDSTVNAFVTGVMRVKGVEGASLIPGVNALLTPGC